MTRTQTQKVRPLFRSLSDLNSVLGGRWYIVEPNVMKAAYTGVKTDISALFCTGLNLGQIYLSLIPRWLGVLEGLVNS